MNFFVENRELLIWAGVIIVVAVMAIAFLPKLLPGSGANEQQERQAVVKRDWTTTGRVNFAMSMNNADPDGPGIFILEVEETSVIESVTGGEMLSVRWRRAKLAEAKQVMATYWECYEKYPELIKLRQPKGSDETAADPAREMPTQKDQQSMISIISSPQ